MNFLEFTAAFKHFDECFKKKMDEVANEIGVTRQEAQVIAFLYNFSEFDTAKDMCEKTRLSKAYVSKAVDTLIEKGYVEAVTEKNDRRYVHMKLTKDAVKKAEIMRKYLKEFFMKIIENIDTNEMNVFYSVCMQIFENSKHIM